MQNELIFSILTGFRTSYTSGGFARNDGLKVLRHTLYGSGHFKQKGSTRLKAYLIRIYEVLKEVLFPSTCLVCGSFFTVNSEMNRRLSHGDIDEQFFCTRSPKDSFNFLLFPFLCSACLSGFTPVESPICSQCGYMFNSRIGEDHLCGDCLESSKHFRVARSIGVYDRTLMELLHRFKYQGKIQLARPFAILLLAALLRYWGNKKGIDLVVPVPLHLKKLRTRGFNQAYLLIREWDRIAGRFHIEIPYQRIDRELLLRKKWTEPQTGLGRNKRITNIKHAFGLSQTAELDSLRILLVDDVYTTGATVNECARVLLEGGAGQVDVLTLARAI